MRYGNLLVILEGWAGNEHGLLLSGNVNKSMGKL
jgi:hypothetical protein